MLDYLPQYDMKSAMDMQSMAFRNLNEAGFKTIDVRNSGATSIKNSLKELTNTGVEYFNKKHEEIVTKNTMTLVSDFLKEAQKSGLKPGTDGYATLIGNYLKNADPSKVNVEKLTELLHKYNDPSKYKSEADYKNQEELNKLAIEKAKAEIANKKAETKRNLATASRENAQANNFKNASKPQTPDINETYASFGDIVAGMNNGTYRLFPEDINKFNMARANEIVITAKFIRNLQKNNFDSNADPNVKEKLETAYNNLLQNPTKENLNKYQKLARSVGLLTGSIAQNSIRNSLKDNTYNTAFTTLRVIDKNNKVTTVNVTLGHLPDKFTNLSQ